MFENGCGVAVSAFASETGMEGSVATSDATGLVGNEIDGVDGTAATDGELSGNAGAGGGLTIWSDGTATGLDARYERDELLARSGLWGTAD